LCLLGFASLLFLISLQATNSLSLRSYDYDTDPQKRAETPDFYGYIPDKGQRRVVLLVIMTFNSATILLARCLGVALLLQVAMSYLFGILGAEMGIYLAYKVLMGDFYHWLPVDGAPGFALSLLVRVEVKIIADFTGVVQFRGPAEMGGLYFTVNTAMGFVFCFAAIKIFFASDVGKAGMLNEDFVMKAFFGLLTFWALNAALGVSIMKKEYRKTFVSLETGCEWAQKFFLEGETDRIKSATLVVSKKKWEPIEEAVNEWVQENWFMWKEEKPDWFTDAWIVKVPDDFIPAEEDRVALQKLRWKSWGSELVFGGTGGGDRNRRLSLGGGAAATIFPASEAVQGAGAQGSGAKVFGVLKVPGEGGAGADEFSAVKKADAEGVCAKMDGSAVSKDDSGGGVGAGE
jgi:hypothetical protein